jgi:LysR family glycine cleavage system transcriptional activator
MRMPVIPLANPNFLASTRSQRRPICSPVPRLSPDDDWWDLWFASLAEPNQANRRQAGIRFESQVLDGHAAIAGHGVAILSPPMFQSAIDAGLLVQPFPQMADLSQRLLAGLHRSRSATCRRSARSGIGCWRP